MNFFKNYKAIIGYFIEDNKTSNTIFGNFISTLSKVYFKTNKRNLNKINHRGINLLVVFYNVFNKKSKYAKKKE